MYGERGASGVRTKKEEGVGKVGVGKGRKSHRPCVPFKTVYMTH